MIIYAYSETREIFIMKNEAGGQKYIQKLTFTLLLTLVLEQTYWFGNLLYFLN